METAIPKPIPVPVLKQLARQKAIELGLGPMPSDKWVNPHFSPSRLPALLTTRKIYIH